MPETAQNALVARICEHAGIAPKQARKALEAAVAEYGAYPWLSAANVGQVCDGAECYVVPKAEIDAAIEPPQREFP